MEVLSQNIVDCLDTHLGISGTPAGDGKLSGEIGNSTSGHRERHSGHNSPMAGYESGALSIPMKRGAAVELDVIGSQLKDPHNPVARRASNST